MLVQACSLNCNISVQPSTVEPAKDDTACPYCLLFDFFICKFVAEPITIVFYQIAAIMGQISKPKPVNLIAGILTSIPDLLEQIDKTLEKHFGSIDLRSDVLSFTFTDYYNEEMGKGILRQFYSFEKLIMPDELAPIKVQTNHIEDSITTAKKYPVKRPINIDPGYINESRLILASTKDFSHRIYLRDGIYAEVTLNYRGGRYESFPWTFPDYKSTDYQKFLLMARDLYVRKLKKEE